MVPGGVLKVLPVFGLGRVLGGSWGFLSPKRLQEVILIDFSLISDEFWLIFGRDFEWFFNDFYDGCHPCLISQVIMNVLNFLLYVSLCMIFQWLLWWLSSLFDTAAHHECFNFFLCLSFCVRFPGNRCGCMSGSEKFGTGLLYSSNKKHVMLTSCDTCVTFSSRHLGCRSFQPLC